MTTLPISIQSLQSLCLELRTFLESNQTTSDPMGLLSTALKVELLKNTIKLHANNPQKLISIVNELQDHQLTILQIKKKDALIWANGKKQSNSAPNHLIDLAVETVLKNDYQNKWNISDKKLKGNQI